MICLYKVLTIICSASILEAKYLKTVNNEFGSDDWLQQKWISIFQSDYSSMRPNILDENWNNEISQAKECTVNVKKNTLNRLEDLSKDEVFVVNPVSKQQRLEEINRSESCSNKIEDLNKTIGSPLGESNLKFYNKQQMKSDTSFDNRSFEKPSKQSLNRSVSKTVSLPSESPANHTAFTVTIPKVLFANAKSFVFNPNAQPDEKYQNCTTPRNESGVCRYLQHCMIPYIVSSLKQFLGYVCIIKERFIGVCCPNLPANVIVVQDLNETHKTDIKITEECGESGNIRIVGGFNADPKAWPWMVALLSKSNKNFFCGGALINSQYILTAAHCTTGVLNNEIIARLGEYDFRDEKLHDEYPVVEIKRHGHYNRLTQKNDVALLKLANPVSSKFTKICLPERKSYTGEIATLVGWGNLGGGGSLSQILQEASFPIVSNEECAKIHGTAISSSSICTLSKAGDKGACNGDSGGPLMLLDKTNRWKIIGIVSWGRRGCNTKFPTVFTRVSHFLEWIHKHSAP